MSDTFSKVEVITGVALGRQFPTKQKLAIVAETMRPGMSISYVARQHGPSPSLVFRWRRLMSEGGKEAIRADDDVVPASKDRGWLATTAGISGEMIRDMMVQCVERRFGTFRAPHRVPWLTDSGSIFAAQKTVEIATALNLKSCFTPVESPESSGMAEAFVKTFKRDYVRVAVLPEADAALALIENWMEDYNTVHPHSRLGYRSPREYIATQIQSAVCPV